MIRLVPAALAALAALMLLAAPALAHDAAIHVGEAYARANGGIGKTGAVFLVIENHTDADDRLIAATSDVAQRVELHTSKESAEGVMQMLPLTDGITIPAAGTAALQRGGDHVMLMGLTRALSDGDSLSLTLTFEKAGEVTLDVPVDNKRSDGGAEDHSGHVMP